MAPPVGGPKQQALLTLLLLRANRVSSTDSVDGPSAAAPGDQLLLDRIKPHRTVEWEQIVRDGGRHG
jgi:hypothetical protein